MDNRESNDKTYAVDVLWTVAKTYYIKAKSREDAYQQIRDKVDSGNVNVWTDGFSALEDVEVECVGEGPDEDNVSFY